ncbi:hypothetical protein ACERZ8_19360 [Tateyamaria armeniaca]|uniref:DUF998 domain-containing protein n=1 Tax=Tateyamaria armeniaca TaxID=2518930 RepID=A0ABW8UXP4_9RHOB
MELLQTGKTRYQPAPAGKDGYAAIDQRALARVVGMVAVGLPVVLWIASHLPSSNPYIDSCFRFSISHFYYAPFWGTVFTGALVFIGAYLIVYKGEDRHDAEKRLASYAGLACFGIALFPTGGWGCDEVVFAARPMLLFDLIKGVPVIQGAFDPDRAFMLFKYASVIHYGSAAVVFFFLAWFCFFVFTAIDDDQRGPDGKPTQVKVIRNALYYAAGTVIVIAILAMGTVFAVEGLLGIPVPWWDAGNWTFTCEAAALIAFGVSWLVKGRFIAWLQDEVAP